VSKTSCTDAIVYVCRNCLPNGEHLPRQWEQNGLHIQVQELPCSGKIDVQRLFGAFEGGGWGICLVTCLKGECTLKRGNYHAETRMRLVRRLLDEVGLEQERIELLRFSPDDPIIQLDEQVKAVIKRFGELGPNPLLSAVEDLAKQPQES
jgi:F420-non-reducing hydrogenase iron-sulfur subunit